MRVADLPSFYHKEVYFSSYKNKSVQVKGILVGYDAEQRLCLVRTDDANGKRTWHDIEPRRLRAAPFKYLRDHPEKNFRYAQILQNRTRL